MKFLEAVIALEKGKKIRHKNWGKGEYVYLEYLSNGRRYLLCEECIDVKLPYAEEGWEIYNDTDDIYRLIR